MTDWDLLPMLIIFLFFGLPWLVVYLMSRRLSALEVELREFNTRLKIKTGMDDA